MIKKSNLKSKYRINFDNVERLIRIKINNKTNMKINQDYNMF